jgi:two-component system NtrC family response regulator
VITIKLPALRERKGDILLLANLFLRRASEELRKKIKGFSAEAVNILQNYEWPGNVRELENKIQRAVIMSDSAMIEPCDLGFTDSPLESGGISINGKLTLKQARERLEREMIQQAIQVNAGNIAKAADELGISRPTLYDLIRKHNIMTFAQ